MKNILLYLNWGILSISCAFAQTPKDDPVWIMQAKGSNDFEYNKFGTVSKSQQVAYFNNRSINSACNVTNECDYHFPQGWVSDETQRDEYFKYHRNFYKTHGMDTNNIELSYGSLKSKLIRHSPPFAKTYNLVGGGDTTINYSYTTTDVESDERCSIPYYLEMRMRLPDGIHDGVQANFYNYVDDFGGVRNDSVKWSEVDIFEYCGKEKIYTHDYHWAGWDQARRALYNTNITHMYQENMRTDDYYWKPTSDVRSSSIDSQWHTYGVEVTKKYVAWYIDGVQKQMAYFPHELGNNPVANSSNPLPFYQWFSNKVPQLVHTMTIEVGVHSQPGFGLPADTPTTSTVIPFIFDIDYIHYYRPILTDSSTNLVETNYDIDSHLPGIYKSITLGGPGGTAVLSNGNKNSLRAGKEIILNDGFEVENGAEIYIIDIKPNK